MFFHHYFISFLNMFFKQNFSLIFCFFIYIYLFILLFNQKKTFFNIFFDLSTITYNGFDDINNANETSTFFFSLIICVFNKFHYLNASFSSILCQNYNDFEIIAVDDCSTDESFFFLKNFSFPHFIIVRHLKNMGLLYSRKSAIKIARGKYIVTLDPDDLLSCNLLTTISQYLKKEEYDILEYSFYFVGNGHNKKSFQQKPGTYNRTSFLHLKWVYWSYWSRCYNKKIIRKGFSLIPENLFRIRLTRTEDLIVFFSTMLFCEKYKIIDFFGYYYYFNLNDSSNKCSDFSCIKNQNDEKLGKEFVKKLWASKNLNFISF